MSSFLYEVGTVFSTQKGTICSATQEDTCTSICLLQPPGIPSSRSVSHTYGCQSGCTQSSTKEETAHVQGIVIPDIKMQGNEGVECTHEAAGSRAVLAGEHARPALAAAAPQASGTVRHARCRHPACPKSIIAKRKNSHG